MFHMVLKDVDDAMPTPARRTEISAPACSESTFVSGNSTHPISVAVVSAAALSGVGDHIDKLPIVMIHGGFHTGRAYLGTPDDRKGWAQLFAARGHEVFVPDWPAHGNSPSLEGIVNLRSLDVAHSLGELLSSIGTCILVAHSAGAPLAWWLAENLPDLVVAIIGIAPGPPANILPELPDDPLTVNALRHDVQAGCPVYAAQDVAAVVDMNFIRDFWANSPRFPLSHIDKYASTIVPESPRILNERFNVGGAGLRLSNPQLVGRRPILIVTGDLDLRHPKQVDSALAKFLCADFVWLPEYGVHSNGHMLMIEDNSHEIADMLMQWLQKKGF